MINLLSYHLRRTKEYTQRYVHTRGFNTTNKKEILWELFVETNRFLDSIGVDYWVNYGTLLGFHREGDFIDHDLDVDFGSRESFYELIWKNRSKLKPGFEMHDTSFRHLGPKLYVSYKGFDADVYFYKEEKGALHSYEKTNWENYNTAIPDQLVFPVKELTIKGVTTRIPANTQQFLETIYGNLSAGAKRNPDTGFWE